MAYFITIVILSILSGICMGAGKELTAYAFLGLIVIISVFFNVMRYIYIKKLSEYLIKIQNLNSHEELKSIYWNMSLKSYSEGELSILKTEVYKVTRMLIEQKERLLSDKTFLADSLADISHQLKTPLTSLTVMADLLEEKDLPDEKRAEFIQNIHVQLNRIEWLVSTLLKMSKLDAGTICLNLKNCNIKKVADRAFSHLLIPMELKNQSLIVEGDLKACCICDENWTAEALANIAKNCMEHTGDGGYIKVSYDENAIYSRIVIEDNGIGIDSEDLPHIFERFYKGKHSSSDSVGIGLAFARQIIAMENGTIDVSSKINSGTRFEIRLYKTVV